MSRNYYEVLGVSPDATDDEIKRAFRALARQHHPDSNAGDPGAAERFKEIGRAYETLRDPERRRRYDMFGTDDVTAGAGPTVDFAFGDLFDAFFGGDPFGRRGPGGPVRGADAEVQIGLTLHEAAFGATRTIEVRLPSECGRCDGSGCEPGTHPSRCDVCGGEGQIRQVRRSILGQMMTAGLCSACGATGRRPASPCRDCRGEGRVQAAQAIDVDVPAGVDTGQRLRLAGRGPAAPRGGPPGDLYVTISVAAHPAFERHGDDLLQVCCVSMVQAALGARITLETLDGPEEVTVPPGTQPGRVFRLKGRGVASLRGRGRGDLLVRVDVEVPERLKPEEAELLRRLAELRGDDVAPEDPGFFSRIKSAFQ